MGGYKCVFDGIINAHIIHQQNLKITCKILLDGRLESS